MGGAGRSAGRGVARPPRRLIRSRTGPRGVIVGCAVEKARKGYPCSVLWIGDPESLPAAGWRLSPGIAYAITTNRVGDLRDRWASPAPLANDVVPAALALAVEGRTRRIGQLLAPMGIRYVALVQSPSPSLEQAKTLVLPSTILTSMADQLDLKAVPVDDAITMYDNLAAVPTNSVFAAGSPGLVSASRPWSDFPAGWAALDPHPAQGSLTGTFDGEGRNFVGLVSAGSIVHTGVTADDGWHLLRAGIEQRPIVTYGYSTGFAIDNTSGPAELSYTTPTKRYAWIALQIGLWVLA